VCIYIEILMRIAAHDAGKCTVSWLKILHSVTSHDSSCSKYFVDLISLSIYLYDSGPPIKVAGRSLSSIAADQTHWECEWYHFLYKSSRKP